MRDGQFALFSMDWDSIPSTALEALFDEIYAFGVEANKRENTNVVLRMADLFGKAVDRLPKLQLLLEELLQAKTVSPQAVHYWLAPYRTRDARVSELLDRDPSFISFHDVFMHLHLKRQEWLDPFISGKSSMASIYREKRFMLCLPIMGSPVAAAPAKGISIPLGTGGLGCQTKLP